MKNCQEFSFVGCNSV